MCCSEKRYSSERKCWEDENETKPEVWVRDSSWDHHFKSFWLHAQLREVVALANSKKNRNIKAYNVNFISMARSTDLFQNNVRKYGFALQIDRMLLSMFCTRFVTLWKSSFPRNPPTPRKLLPLNPPSPSEFPMVFRGGGGVWIFSGTTH